MELANKPKREQNIFLYNPNSVRVETQEESEKWAGILLAKEEQSCEKCKAEIGAGTKYLKHKCFVGKGIKILCLECRQKIFDSL